MSFRQHPDIDPKYRDSGVQGLWVWGLGTLEEFYWKVQVMSCGEEHASSLEELFQKTFAYIV